MIRPDLNNNEEKFSPNKPMFLSPLLRRRMKSTQIKYFLLWLLSIVLVIWFMSSSLDNCNNREHGQFDAGQFAFQHVNDNINDPNMLGADSIIDTSDIYPYSRNSPLIFVGGVPRSGTTLMRAMLDAHPDVRCGEETRIIPRIIYMRNQWANSKKEYERLQNAGMTDEVIDSAVSSFVLNVIVKHGKKAKHLCNKDPLVLRYSAYMNKVFPKSKYILMIRDGRSTVHSIISRKVTITGFNLGSYKDCLMRWNSIIESMYAQCIDVGPETCMPVYYEQLVLHPERNMRAILKFLNIPFNEAVLHHEEYIGKEISLSKVERSSDQVIKPVNLEALSKWVGQIPGDVLSQMDQIAPMLRKLGYDPFANPPNYGEADKEIMENTHHINNNKEYWKELAKKYSIHATDIKID